MTLRYEFVTEERPFYFTHGGYEDVDYETETTEFEYEPDYDDVLRFFNELSEVEFVDGCKHAWEQLSEEQKAFFLNPDNGYATADNVVGDEFNWNVIYRDLDIKGDIVSELLLNDEEYWEEALKDEFESAARDAFDDM